MKRWAARTDSKNGSDRESIIPPLGEKKGMSATFFSVRAVQHLWQRNSKVSNWQSMKNSPAPGLVVPGAKTGLSTGTTASCTTH